MFTKRALATLLDLVIVIIISLGCYYYADFIINWMHPLFFVIVLGIYQFLADLLGGRTPGKSICKLAVASKTTDKLTFWRLIYRDILLKYGVFTLVPFLFLFYGIGLGALLSFFIALAVPVLINLIYFFFKKELIWDTISKTQIIDYVKIDIVDKPRFYKEMGAFFLDLSIVATLSTLIYLIFLKHTYVPYYRLFLIVAICYSIITNMIFKASLGSVLCGIKLKFSTSKNQYLSILLRELIKWTPAVLYFALLDYFHYENRLFNTIFILFFYFILYLFSKMATGMIWWDLITKTAKKNVETPKPHKRILFISVLLFFIISFLTLMHCNNKFPSKVKFLGFNFYTYNIHYPDNQNLKDKVAFIESVDQTPKEYIFDLFEKHDIVVLCETFHPEMTQWEFIYDVVSDSRFINNVGHLFTEYGASNYQENVNKYLTTRYENDTLLEKATTDLLRNEGQWIFWHNYNFFNFLKKINKLNNTLPDSLKIREYFTDVHTFDKSIKNYEDHLKKKRVHRDSCMASTIMKTFETIQSDSTRKKCLVIMNYRHAFNDTKNYKNERDYVYYEDATSYLFYNFKDQVANVFIHNISVGGNGYPFIYPPIQNSSWDKAFELCGNKPVGFDFQNSPFGSDICDIFTNFGKRTKNTYQDIFTGMVFLNPTSNFWFKTGIPYLMDDFESEYARRLLISGKDTTNLNARIEEIRTRKEKVSYFYNNPVLMLTANFPIVFYLFSFFLGFITLIVSLVLTLRKF